MTVERKPSQTTVIPAADRLSQVQEYYFATKMAELANLRAAGHPVLNIGIGSPDLPPSQSAIKALHEASERADQHGYQSYIGIPELRKAMSDWYARTYQVTLNPLNEVLPLIGSKEGIVHIAMSFLNPGDVALVPNPGYPSYKAATLLAGATALTYDLKAEHGWLPDWEALEALDLTKVKIMWLNYPHMPTGTSIDEVEMHRFLAFAKRHQILLVNDNPYSLILNDHPRSFLSMEDSKSWVIELNSLSKSHNMSGWRVGMMLGDAALLKTVIQFKSNMDSGMFKPLQLAAVAALEAPSTWTTDLNAVYEARKTLALSFMEKIGCPITTEQTGMFLWGKVRVAGHDGYSLSDDLLYKHHVFCTPGGVFGSNGKDYIRISLCSPKEVLQEALRRLD